MLAEKPNSSRQHLLESMPKADDSQWVSRLYNVPKINFGTIISYLVERQVLLKKVVLLEGIVDERQLKQKMVNLIGKAGSF